MKKRYSIGILAVVLLCTSLVVGKNMYARTNYTKGKAAYEAENYQDAQTYLHRALKWDLSSEEILAMYLEASYQTQQYAYVIAAAEKMDVLTPEQNRQVVDSYEGVIANYLEMGNTTKAIQTLKKVQELYPAQRYTNQLLSLQKKEDVVDENGVTWNNRGQIVQIENHGQKIVIEYTDSHITSMYNEKGKGVEDFDFQEEGTQYNVTFYQGIPPWECEKAVRDEEGNLIERTTQSEGQKDQTTYTYHRNSAGRIEKESQWRLADDSSSTWEYLYEDGVLQSKNQTIRGVSQGNYVQYSYDEEGRVTCVQEYQNLITLVYEKQFVYDEEGNVVQVVEMQNGRTLTYDYTIEAYRAVYATVSEDGEVIQDMYAVKDNGWIIVERKDS